MSVSMSVSVRMSALICASIISIRVALNVIDIMQIHKELQHPDAFSSCCCCCCCYCQGKARHI